MYGRRKSSLAPAFQIFNDAGGPVTTGQIKKSRTISKLTKLAPARLDRKNSPEAQAWHETGASHAQMSSFEQLLDESFNHGDSHLSSEGALDLSGSESLVRLASQALKLTEDANKGGVDARASLEQKSSQAINGPIQVPFSAQSNLSSQRFEVPGDAGRHAKVATLLREAEQLGVQSQKKAATWERQIAIPSPRTLAKKVLSKAAHAVKHPFGRGGAPDSDLFVVASPVKLGAHSNTQITDLSAHARRISDDVVFRKEAEGTNLAKAKIRSLVGEKNQAGTSPRLKRPRPLSFDPMLALGGWSLTESYSEVGTGPETSVAAAKEDESLSLSAGSQRPSHDRLALGPASVDGKVSIELAEGVKPPTEASSGPSSMVSGLAQHSDTMSFSNPLDGSTPWEHSRTLDKKGIIHRTPAKAAHGARNSVTPGASSAGLNANMTPVSLASVSESSQSVKRKSAHENLRATAGPAVKKLKLTPPHKSVVDATNSLALHLGQMETTDDRDRAPLSNKNPNTKLARHLNKPARKLPAATTMSSGKQQTRGMGIFDTVLRKGKARLSPAPASTQSRSAAKGNSFTISHPHMMRNSTTHRQPQDSIQSKKTLGRASSFRNTLVSRKPLPNTWAEDQTSSHLALKRSSHGQAYGSGSSTAQKQKQRHLGPALDSRGFMKLDADAMEVDELAL